MPSPIRRYAEKYLPAGAVNFWCHVIEGTIASFGEGIVAGAVVFPILPASLGATPFILGLLTSLSGLSFLAPVLAAPALEAARRKKLLVLLLGVGQRLPLLLISVCLVLLAARAPLLCLALIAALLLARNVAVSLLYPPWIELLAETIPHGRVGRMFGFRQSLSSAMGLLAGPACGTILAFHRPPGNYAVLYLAAFAMMAMSWFLFTLVDEVPRDAPVRARRPVQHFYRELFGLLRPDQDYRRYLAFQALNRFGTVATSFYAMVAVRELGVSEAFAAGAFIAASRVATIVGNLTFPFGGERFGHKRVLALGVLLQVAAAALAGFAPSGHYYLGVFFLLGLAMATKTVSGTPFMIAIAPRGRRVGYTTLGMGLLAPVGIICAPLAGLLMQELGHATVFLFMGGAVLLSLWPLARSNPKFNDDKDKETRHGHEDGPTSLPAD